MKRVCDLAVSRVGQRLGTDGGGVLGAAALLLLSLAVAGAQVPLMLNYQGRVQVGTNDFNGAGQFKFALVNANGSTTYWSNDGTASGQPGAAVTLPVTQGLYSVLLGNTNLPGMAAVPPAAFTNGDVHLRVWFNDGVNGFQQFVPDQRVAAAAYAVNAGNAVTAGSLTGPISVDQLPVEVPRAANGITTITGNVVVEGTLTAAGLNSDGVAGSSGLPAGTRIDVLINDAVAPGVQFEGLEGGSSTVDLSLSRVMTDLSWPDLFHATAGTGWSNPPVALRLTLPGGAEIIWKLRNRASLGDTGYYTVGQFRRKVGSDRKPYDFIVLRGALSRTNVNVFAQGSVPAIPVAGRSSGQPVAASMRLNVDGLNFNNVVFAGEIPLVFERPCEILLNPTFHTTLSAWALGEVPLQRSVQVMLVNGLPGVVSVATSAPSAHPDYYGLRLASDGLPVEVIRLVDK